jgi:hypothetical protein
MGPDEKTGMNTSLRDLPALALALALLLTVGGLPFTGPSPADAHHRCGHKAKTCELNPEPAPEPAPEPTSDPESEPTQEAAPDPAPAPTPSPALLSTAFSGSDGTFVSSGAFWTGADSGLTENPDWFAESGTMFGRSETGWTNASVFRMWTRQTDLAFSQVAMDIRFNGWSAGSSNWHGVNLWLNRRLRTPTDGSRVNDGPQQEGYAVDFLNRDGKLYIQKKVGDAYYILKQDAWQPVAGRWYRWAGRVIDNGNGTNTIQVLVDGRVVQQVIDDGSVGGPRLTGGRVGVRGDYADFNVDNLTITRP